MPINIETLRSITNERETIVAILADGDAANPGVWEQSGNIWRDEEARKWRAFGREVIEGPAVFSGDDPFQLRHPSTYSTGNFIINNEFKRCWIDVKGRRDS